jgi:hypothetical protein
LLKTAVVWIIASIFACPKAVKSSKPLKVGVVIKFTTALRVTEIIEEGAVATGETGLSAIGFETVGTAGLFSDFCILTLSRGRPASRLSRHGKSLLRKYSRYRRKYAVFRPKKAALVRVFVRRQAAGPRPASPRIGAERAPGDLDRGVDLMFRDAITAHDELSERIGQQLGELRFRPRTTERFCNGSLPWPIRPDLRKFFHRLMVREASFRMSLN